jgi:hypothetical protein
MQNKMEKFGPKAVWSVRQIAAGPRHHSRSWLRLLRVLRRGLLLDERIRVQRHCTRFSCTVELDHITLETK